MSDLKVNIIDEISMVSKELLFYIHLRLNKMLGSVNNKPFQDTLLIVVGNLLQQPPFEGGPVFANYKNYWQSFNLLWIYFKIFE